MCQVPPLPCSGCPKRCLGTGKQEWCLPVPQVIAGVWLRAAWLCLLHVLTVTTCRCLTSWTRSAGRWQKKPKTEDFQSMTEKETSANALTMQTKWVGGGTEGLPRACGTGLAVLTVLSVSCRHDKPRLPLPSCRGPGQAAPGAAGAGSLHGHGSRSCSLVHPVTGMVWLCLGTRGEMCPACFPTLPLLVVSWLQSGVRK